MLECKQLNKKNNFLADYLPIVFLIILALIIRLYKLDEIPPGNWYDEAINGLDALSILKAKFPPVFFMTEGHPREALFMYLILLNFKIFGISYITLRLTSIIIGTITILFCYLFTKEFFDKRTAFLSALILAFLRWHIHFSRTSFRTILTPLFLLLVFYFLKKGIKNKKTILFIISGICFGLGFHTYLAFRLSIIILIIYLFSEIQKCRRGIYASPTTIIEKSQIESTEKQPTLLKNEIDSSALPPHNDTTNTVILSEAKNLVILWRAQIKQYSKHILLFIISAFIIFLPLLIDYVINPIHFLGRADEISLFKNGFVSGIKEILLNIKNVAMMFAFKGDHVAKHNIPLMPVFEPVTAILFYLGLTISILKIKKSPSYVLTVSWFFIMLLATILSYGSPNMLRTVSITPVLAIFIAIGLLAITDKLKRKFSPQLSIIIIIIFIMYFASVELYRYFFIWAKHPQTYLEFNSNFADAARTLNELDENTTIFVYEPLFKHPTFDFETINHKSKYATFTRKENGEFQFSKEPSKGSLILATDWDLIYNLYLRNYYPDGKIIGGFKLPNGYLWAVVFQVN